MAPRRTPQLWMGRAARPRRSCSAGAWRRVQAVPRPAMTFRRDRRLSQSGIGVAGSAAGAGRDGGRISAGQGRRAGLARWSLIAHAALRSSCGTARLDAGRRTRAVIGARGRRQARRAWLAAPTPASYVWKSKGRDMTTGSLSAVPGEIGLKTARLRAPALFVAPPARSIGPSQIACWPQCSPVHSSFRQRRHRLRDGWNYWC